MEKQNPIKIIFRTAKVGLIEIEEIMGSKNNLGVIEKYSASFSVTTLPTCKLNLTPNAQYPNLIFIQSGDEIEIFQGSIKMFSGFLSSVRVKSAKNQINIEIDGISHFYLLQNTVLNTEDFVNKEGLREVLTELLSICTIPCNVCVDVDVPNAFAIGAISKFPAQALLNAICYKYDLVFMINSSEIQFSRRLSALHQMQNNHIFTIDESDIISSEFKQ